MKFFTSKDDIYKYLLAYFFTHEKTLEINFSSLLIENGEITILHINCSLLGNEHESYPISPTATFFQITFSYLQIKMIWIWNWIHIRYIYYICTAAKQRLQRWKVRKKSILYGTLQTQMIPFPFVRDKSYSHLSSKRFLQSLQSCASTKRQSSTTKNFFFPSLLFQLSNDDLDMWKLTWTEKKFTLFVTIDEAN